MQFFLFLNDLAGRSPFLDGCARFYYVGAVPVLAALFLAQLLLISRIANPERARLALAVALSLLFLALIGLAIESLSTAWHLGTLSPRPFMTRRVHLLVVEPQNNSFPCFEVAIAAIFSTAMAFSSRKWGVTGGVLTLLLALVRLFCGTNFLADVAIGALLGGGLCAAFAALCTAPQPLERAALRSWSLASAVVILSLGASYVAFAETPRFAAKLPLFWNSPATAADSTPLPGAGDAPGEVSGVSPDSSRRATRAARAAIGEGEGLSEAPATVSTSANGETANGETANGETANGEPSAEELALSKRSHLFLPAVEKFLRGRLTPHARPFRLLDVEVAPVRAGNSTYRCAALRFEITQEVPDLRRRTAEIAANLVKLAFQSDSNLQNVDVTAILRGDGTQIDGTSLRFAGDEVPVFTASIERQNLRVAAPRWANDPRLDGGSWLRTRSRLYINDKILPASLASALQLPRVPPKPVQPLPIPAKPVQTPFAAPPTSLQSSPSKPLLQAPLSKRPLAAAKLRPDSPRKPVAPTKPTSKQASTATPQLRKPLPKLPRNQ